MSYTPVVLPGKFGFGTMSMTWTANPVPYDKAFATIKHCLDKHNIRVLNGGEFYGPDFSNLKLLGEFWKKYGSEYPDLIVSIKGGIDLAKFRPDASEEGLARSINTICSYFPSEKSKRPTLIFESARVDPTVPYETNIERISAFVKEGKIDGISLSEVGVESIKKAVSVFPISCVELELSLLCQDILDNGILAELSEKQIPIVAYSPLCRGFLTDATANDPEAFQKMCANDVRSHIDKLAPHNFPTNLKVVKKLHEFAQSKGITLESLALSWICSISELENFNGIKKVCKIMSIPSGSTIEKVDRNMGEIVKLTLDDLEKIKAITDEHKVVGYRYNADHKDFA